MSVAIISCQDDLESVLPLWPENAVLALPAAHKLWATSLHFSEARDGDNTLSTYLIRLM